MAYDWTQLGVKEITNLYLYGTSTTPSDLISDSRIRPDPLTPPTKIDVNMASFMATGPGRFALGSQSALIETFFSSETDLSWMRNGFEYTKTQFIAELTSHGVSLPGFYGIDIKQVLLDDLSGDYWERAYIWNSGRFQLSDDAIFLIDADGNRIIKNYAIKPLGSENFDFVGGGRIADFANAYLKERIDPWGIARRVDINFVDDITQTRDYTFADYAADVAKHDGHVAAGIIKLPTLGVGGAAITAQLWDSGVTKFLFQDKAIIYGTNDADTLSTSQLDGLPLVSSLKDYGKANGVVLVAGGGNDTLTGGVHADYLYGGAGNDTLTGKAGFDHLEGGQGFDTYVLDAGDGYDALFDSDGQGAIRLEGLTVKGSDGLDAKYWKQLDADTWADTQNGITYSRLTEGGATQLFIHQGDSALLVQRWREGDLGIVLGAAKAPALPVTTGTGSTSAASDHFFYGSLGNDLLQGTAATDYFAGREGNDIVDGGGGNDVLAGGSGDSQGGDVLKGGDGDDLILGDGATAISDLERYDSEGIVLTGISNVSTADGVPSFHYDQPRYVSVGSAYTTGDDSIYGGAGNDVVEAGRGNDYVEGGDGDDIVWADSAGATKANDIVLGQGGNDILIGDSTESGAQAGDDYLSGGDGNDYLWGAGGNDVLLGGGGNDFLLGGTGDDILEGGDGDGIETVPPRSTEPILFDHTGDGIKTSTGWLKADPHRMPFRVMHRRRLPKLANGAYMAVGRDTCQI